jgi:hypothetical protein
MPNDNVQVLDDFELDLNIETIPLDDIDKKENLENKEALSSSDSPIEIRIENLDLVENTPEPSIPIEGSQADSGQELLNDSSIFSIEDDIISIDGNDLDKVIYGIETEAKNNETPLAEESSTETFAESPNVDIPEQKIEDIIVMEEPAPSGESLEPLEDSYRTEELIFTDDLGDEIKNDASSPLPSEEFNFDLSVIPDVAEIEEDEPIALSIEELNNIDISESKGNLEEQLNAVQADISPTTASENKKQVIEEKLASLSSDTKDELRTVLCYLDTLLEDLPEEKIKAFAKSEYYDLYVKILDKLGV